ncbi:MAG TPA: aspartate kinase [Caulobacteraceae bacterium]|nr:aspartate kinase [Caulobacteraceae bacterium]
MSRIVMKFGGTSVADLERIRRVARIVASEARAGHQVAVVVSAMAGRTNELVAWTDGAGPAAPGLPASDDEYDVVVASGEQVSAGLLSMTLRNLGLHARSWLGWQVPIVTDNAHGKARIDEVSPDKLEAALAAGEIPVVAGFQGIDRQGRLATLGRGAGDLSAVAVAAALKADRCDIYTDVDGVYTTDPRIEERAKRLPRISYEEMLEMASLGARVLQSRSVELAMAQRVPLRVLSSFAEPGASDNQGTIVCDEEEIVEKRIVSGVAYSRDEAKISLFGLPDHPGVASDIFGRLGDANVNVDMIVQSHARTPGSANMEFTVGKRDAARALDIVLGAKGEIGLEDAVLDDNVAKISVIGVGMRSNTGVAQTMFKALAEKGVNIQVISTSEIKISVLIDAAYTELAVRALHSAYGLDKA